MQKIQQLEVQLNLQEREKNVSEDVFTGFRHFVVLFLKKCALSHVGSRKFFPFKKVEWGSRKFIFLYADLSYAN
jgi:hypothetical protein